MKTVSRRIERPGQGGSMELNSKNMKRILFVIITAIVVFLGLQNFNVVVDFFKFCYALLSPFIIGICTAFMLNVLLKLIEERLFGRINKKSGKIWARCRRPVCLLLTYGLVVGLLFILFFLIIPELGKSFDMLVNNIPTYAEEIQKWTDTLLDKLPLAPETVDSMRLDWDSLLNHAGNFIKENITPQFLNTTVDITSAIFTGIFNFVVGIAFSVYILMQKEKLCRQAKWLLLAYLPKKRAEYLIAVGKLANRTFARFVAGQVTEAGIIGVLCFIGMNIFSMPYSALISTIVGCTALVPIFGAFIGTGIGAFLLLMVEPITAFWFIVFILVLQQLEGNIIYPRVVGSSIGLPGIWVLFVVTLGGGLFGVMGMLIGIPLASISYSLLKSAVGTRLKKREITEEVVEYAGEDIKE